MIPLYKRWGVPPDKVTQSIDFVRRRETLLHGGFARRVLTSRRLRSCYSSEYRTPELVHPVERLDGNCNFSRTTGTGILIGLVNNQDKFG